MTVAFTVVGVIDAVDKELVGPSVVVIGVVAFVVDFDVVDVD